MTAVQKKGLVFIYYDVSKPGRSAPLPDLSFLLASIEVSAAVPVRCSASHICLKAGIGRSLSLHNVFLGHVFNGSIIELSA